MYLYSCEKEVQLYKWIKVPLMWLWPWFNKKWMGA